MVDIINSIIDKALETNKHIWVIGSARSGTHALGSAIAQRNSAFTYKNEICGVDGRATPWKDIELFYQHNNIIVGQTVGFTSKINLTGQVDQIKEHALIVNIKRQDKISQFASWMYFTTTNAPFELWHNHRAQDTLIGPNSITVSQEQLDHFIVEQTIDDFFLPDFIVCYEELQFTDSQYKKNEFLFDLKNIFTNLEFVEERLKTWNYSKGHFIPYRTEN
jgi:hypothetical protein